MEKLNIKSGMFYNDKTEIKIGDKIIMNYITPLGNVCDGVYEEEEIHEVIFKYGCFGIETKTHFIPLFNIMKLKEGQYISNVGNKVIYTEEYYFKKII